MPLPRALARFNRVVTNRVFAPLAGRVPPWVIVEHRGRRSGRLYHTVVWAFRRGDDLVFALTYGPTADWVQNVLRAQECRVMDAGRWRSFTRADVLEGAAGLRLLPAILRPLLDTGGVRTILRLRGPAQPRS